MQAIKGIFGWLGSKGIVFVLLVAALVLAPLVLPWVQSEWTGPDTTRARLAELRSVKQAAGVAQAQGEARFATSVNQMRGASIAAIDRRLGQARRERDSLNQERPTGPVVLRYMKNGTAGLIAEQKRGVQIALLEREIASLNQARMLATARGNLLRYTDLPTRLRNAASAQRQCNAARRRVRQFEGERFGRWTLFRREERTRLTWARETMCTQADTLAARVRGERNARLKALRLYRTAGQAFDATTQSIGTTLAKASEELDRQIKGDDAAVNGSLKSKAQVFAQRNGVAGKARVAAWLLLGIILTPFAIRALFYFVLAPIAARRAAVRFVEGAGARNVAIPLAARSTTSVAVRLAAGEELLVRQDYLQSTSQGGTKATRWLLSWRYPLSSIATGLVFLTRVRGTDEVTTVSAVRDQIAEVTILTLPDGAACVLHPRALAAVVQPMARPMGVTSHWRVASLHAWLTLQLRYLVFHGPARIVVKGGRGVRVEAAERGRIFGQDQLVGFSTDLAYSVTRTETFWPYFFGRETLLKDRVAGGQGVLIVEEAPMAGREGAGVRRGLEGAMDAALKVVGL